MDEDKVFIVDWGSIQTRHDPFFYLPKYIQLEKQVLARTKLKLRDFIHSLASGATPKAEEQEKYYANIQTGIPFVRVQNLQVSGEIDLGDVKYINRETHNGLLLRSHVSGSDLLVKITGVGRMAVSSVPPPDFEGNINQHIACIKTGNRRVSKVLAAYLNTDIAEMLAKRRSTGGTRPALDYEALRSIPILYDERILPALTEAFNRHKQALRLAADKLGEIDAYLLAELGIHLPPEPENTLASRMFTARRRELAGGRFDPKALHPEREQCIAEMQSKNSMKLRQVAFFHRDLRTEIPEGLIYIGLENVESNTGRYIPSSEKESVSSAFFFRRGQILFPKLRPYLNKVFLAPFDGLCSTEFHVLEGRLVSSDFLALFLRSRIVVKQTQHLMSGNTLPRLQTEDIEELLVPLVEPDIQACLVGEASRRIVEAEKLRQQAEAELDEAKRRIEALLLGEA